MFIERTIRKAYYKYIEGLKEPFLLYVIFRGVLIALCGLRMKPP
jgi:hypothetical protein